MKTETEIQEHIAHLKDCLENGYLTVAPPQGSARIVMKSWVRALEWTLNEKN